MKNPLHLMFRDKMEKHIKLIISIILDILGMVTYFHPLSEFLDLIYAPIQALIIYLLYKDPYWAGLALAEEALPYTDVIPTATLAWYDYYHNGAVKRLFEE